MDLEGSKTNEVFEIYKRDGIEASFQLFLESLPKLNNHHRLDNISGEVIESVAEINSEEEILKRVENCPLSKVKLNASLS